MAKKATSEKVAKISGRIMRKWAKLERGLSKSDYVAFFDRITWGDIITLAASNLSQTEPAKVKRKAR